MASAFRSVLMQQSLRCDTKACCGQWCYRRMENRVRYKVNRSFHSDLHEWLVVHANQARNDLCEYDPQKKCCELSQRFAHRPGQATHRP